MWGPPPGKNGRAPTPRGGGRATTPGRSTSHSTSNGRTTARQPSVSAPHHPDGGQQPTVSSSGHLHPPKDNSHHRHQRPSINGGGSPDRGRVNVAEALAPPPWYISNGSSRGGGGYGGGFGQGTEQGASSQPENSPQSYRTASSGGGAANFYPGASGQLAIPHQQQQPAAPRAGRLQPPPPTGHQHAVQQHQIRYEGSEDAIAERQSLQQEVQKLTNLLAQRSVALHQAQEESRILATNLQQERKLKDTAVASARREVFDEVEHLVKTEGPRGLERRLTEERMNHGLYVPTVVATTTNQGHQRQQSQFQSHHEPQHQAQPPGAMQSRFHHPPQLGNGSTAQQQSQRTSSGVDSPGGGGDYQHPSQQQQQQQQDQAATAVSSSSGGLHAPNVYTQGPTLHNNPQLQEEYQRRMAEMLQRSLAK